VASSSEIKIQVTQSNIKSILIRREHKNYIKTNNLISAYVLHILNNKHKYGNPEQTIQLLEPCNNGKKMSCRESFYIPALQQKKNLLIDEQKVNEPNPLYSLANVTRRQVT
jgi:hypothetical protein